MSPGETVQPELHPTVRAVTERIQERSRGRRTAYLERLRAARQRGPRRLHLACSNLAHSFAAAEPADKARLAGQVPEDSDPGAAGSVNVGIVTAYNDMLSAHQPFVGFPREIKWAVREVGAVAQVAGGVPAMCDGVTQGEPGMELSLFSRDVIAQSTAIALSHGVFDAAICLGVCDKIIPGLLIGALSFGHLPMVFMPAGPMPSGLSNDDKRRIRQRHAEGEVSDAELLRAESAAYHAPGTCTFFGTANSNQMFMELMGLHLPGASFENPNTPIRRALTAAGARRVVELARRSPPIGIGEMIDERSLVNAIVGLLATGGSTNHTIHLVAIARAAGVLIDWQDMDDLSAVVPLLARVYPNGKGDVNAFHRAGGLAYLIDQLLAGGLLHGDIETVAGSGLDAYRRRLLPIDSEEPAAELSYADQPMAISDDRDLLRPIDEPFQDHGGLRLMQGNLGRSVIKLSAVRPEHHRIEAPARVFERQEDVQQAFHDGQLDGDAVIVVRHQGPRANGMPELHKLMPPLGALQDRGHRIALVTDGRLSGASGKIAAAIHLTPEAFGGGPLSLLRDGDPILLDGEAGRLDVLLDEVEWRARKPVAIDLNESHYGTGRELFAGLRHLAASAELGAWTFGDTEKG